MNAFCSSVIIADSPLSVDNLMMLWVYGHNKIIKNRNEGTTLFLISARTHMGFCLINGKYLFEVGGENKDFVQIANFPDSYRAIDVIIFGCIWGDFYIKPQRCGKALKEYQPQ